VISIAAFLAFLWGAALAFGNFRQRKADKTAALLYRRGILWMLSAIIAAACLKLLDLLN